jgi:hypothetical protein
MVSTERETDYTTMRLGARLTNGGKVERCPACGRKASISRYKDGTGLAKHRGRVEYIFVTITDSCYLSAAMLSGKA